ncbi:hypothetical protein Tco_1362748 [Tanacetum coccineum]
MHVHDQSSPGASTALSYSPGPSTPPTYSSGPSTPPSYFPRPSRNAECSNCKLLFGKIKVAAEDFRVAGVINKLCEEVAAANEERGYFIQELDDVPDWVVATHKTSQFLKETQKKDNERLRQLEALMRETEARACEKCIFI